jgi:hypothetical protein
VFGERKVSELRAWFDSRLEDAIKAAEEEGKEENNKVTTQGRVPFDCQLSYLWLRFLMVAYVNGFGFFLCVLSTSVVIVI